MKSSKRGNPNLEVLEELRRKKGEKGLREREKMRRKRLGVLQRLPKLKVTIVDLQIQMKETEVLMM